MVVLGITGGVGSGKSRVLNLLRDEYGAYIIEADKLAHELMEPDKVIYKEIIKVFGEDILLEDGSRSINRMKLGNIVFQDEKKLHMLNQIVHPLVKASILASIEQAKKENKTNLFVIEAALLIEDGYQQICDELWYIFVSPETRIKRLMKQRNYTREKCLSIMKSQSSDDYYEANTDVIIHNNDDFSFTSAQIKARLNNLL